MTNASDDEFTFRRLESTDFDKGFLEVLKGLTKVGDTTKAQFQHRFSEMFPRLEEIYKVIVVEDVQRGVIIGTGTLLLKKKFIFQSGTTAHYTNIVVDKTYRGKNLGRYIVELLKSVAEANGCFD